MPEALIAPAFYLVVFGALYFLHGRRQDPIRRRQILFNGVIGFAAFVVAGIVVRTIF